MRSALTLLALAPKAARSAGPGILAASVSGRHLGAATASSLRSGLPGETAIASALLRTARCLHDSRGFSASAAGKEEQSSSDKQEGSAEQASTSGAGPDGDGEPASVEQLQAKLQQTQGEAEKLQKEVGASEHSDQGADHSCRTRTSMLVRGMPTPARWPLTGAPKTVFDNVFARAMHAV